MDRADDIVSEITEVGLAEKKAAECSIPMRVGEAAENAEKK